MTRTAMNRQKRDLTSGPVQKHLVRLTIPMVWGIFAVVSFQLADMFFISRLGTDALAAFSYTIPVTMLIFHLVMGLGIATSSVLSRLLGKQAEETAQRILTHATLLACAIGIVLAVAGIALLDPVFLAMGAEPGMLPMIRDYMLIWFPGITLLTIPMINNSAMRAHGDATTPALIMCGVALINVIFDPLLIFGLAGFPRLGIQGAALATVLANLCALAVGLYILHKRGALASLQSLQLHLFGDSCKKLFHIALPAGLTTAITPLTHAVIVAFLSGFGAEAVAAFGIVSRVEAFAFIILMALATGMAPIIGQNWGGEKFDRVNRTLRLALGFTALWSAGVAAILALSGRALGGLFADDPVIIGITALYFLIVPATFVPGNLIHGWASAYNAMGLPKRSFVMIVVRMLILQIPLAWLGAEFFGLWGVFSAIALTNIAAGTGFHLLNRRDCIRRERDRVSSS